jgi:hypothetical protein
MPVKDGSPSVEAERLNIVHRHDAFFVFAKTGTRWRFTASAPHRIATLCRSTSTCGW